MKDHFDVIVLGGGPAGTAAALTLMKRPDLRALVIEKSNYDAPRAGEALSPGVRNILGYLGVWEGFAETQSLRTWGNQAAWGSEAISCLDFMFTVHGSGWALDRAQFDGFLASALVANGGQLWENTTCLSCEWSSDMWALQVADQSGNLRQLSAAYIIDAAGRASPWSIQNGAVRQRHDNLVGISGMVVPTSEDQHSFTTVEAVQYGWWYTAPLPNGKTVVTLMSDAGITKKRNLSALDVWCAALRETQHVNAIIGTCLPTSLRVYPAYSSQLLPNPAVAMVASGDAISSHDPLSSSGIPGALASGIQAARVVADALFGEGTLKAGYHDSVAQDYQTYLQTRWRYYGLETRFSAADFWRFRQTPVRLDPNAQLGGVGIPKREDSIFVPKKTARAISEHAKRATTAHQIVESIRRANPNLPDQRIILAVQDLLETKA